jgi:hypothetical protein
MDYTFTEKKGLQITWNIQTSTAVFRELVSPVADPIMKDA